MNTQKNTQTPADTPSTACLADVDVAVIGGGVVGCAVARRMSLEGASVVLIEKAADILDGASKGNSAILHTGFDAPPDSLEHQCVRRGYEEYLTICKEMNLPVRPTGAMVTAWTQEEEDRFEAILAKGKKNGIEDLRLLSRKEILDREPALAGHVRAAILVPGESIVDPWSAPLAYLKQSVMNGGQALFNARVIGGEFDGKRWTLETVRGQVKAGLVINAAGLYGDRVEADVRGSSFFTIKPRKGQFVVFDKAASKLLSSIVLPVPTARTKGIVLFPTIFGNLVVGPTAEEQESRSNASVDRTILKELQAQAIAKIPGLKDMPVTTTYAGIRPATEESPYRVAHDPDQNWITLGGIRSTGLTGALGIARHTAELARECGLSFTALDSPKTPTMPNLAQDLPRDFNTPGYEEIVCHCEMVTQREIQAAMEGELPAGSLSGLKRRTRATMGRCQGFYCSARLAELTRNQFASPLGMEIKGGDHE